MLKQQVTVLEENIKKLHETGKTEKESNRSFDSFKARVLDLPWRQTLQPALDSFKELDQIISDRICTGFPKILYELQQKIVQMVFKEINYRGIKVI